MKARTKKLSLVALANQVNVRLRNGKGISQKELETILAQATPPMRAQILRELDAQAKPAPTAKTPPKKSRAPRAKTSWGKDSFIDRIGARLSRTKLRRALNPDVGAGRKLPKTTCSKCGGAHHVNYCNASGIKAAKPKKNLFGLGKKERKQRAKKRRAKRSLKADRLEAKARYLRAIGNPAGKGSKKIQAVQVDGKKAKSIHFWISERTSINDVLVAARRHMKAATGSQRVDNWSIVDHSDQPSTALQNPLHPLEVGSHLVGIMVGAQALSKGNKKKGPGRRPVRTRYYLFVGADRRGNHIDTKPEAVAAARGLANSTGAVVTVRKLQGTSTVAVKTIRPQTQKRQNSKPTSRRSTAKRNGAPGEIFEEFTGGPSTKVTTGYVAADAPKNVGELGDVLEFTIADPNAPVVSIGIAEHGTERRLNGRVIKFKPGALKLCGIEKPNGKRRFVVGVREEDRGAWLQRFRQNGTLRYGPVAQVVYKARKPHLYNGDMKRHVHYHILGEEGGRRPTLVVKNGCPTLLYGDYEITREGIRN